MRIKRQQPWLWLSLGLATLIGVCVFSPVRAIFDEAFLVTEFKQLGGYAPVVFVLLFTVSLTLGLPGNVLAVAGGAVFGLTWGTLLSLFGSTFGAVGAFGIARYLFHDSAKQRFNYHPWLQRLNRSLACYPFTFVVAVRLTPLSPFSLVNFLFGLTPIDLKTYTVATFLGLIPLTFAYCWLGASGNTALHGGDRLPLFLALALLTLLSILPILTKKTVRGNGR